LLFSIFFVIICWLSWIGEKYSWTWTVYSQCNRTKVSLNSVPSIHLIYFLIKTWIRIVDPPWKMLIRIRKKVIRISSRYKAFFLFKKFFNILFYFFSLKNLIDHLEIRKFFNNFPLFINLGFDNKTFKSISHYLIICVLITKHLNQFLIIY